MYHVLTHTYPSSAFSHTPVFANTLLKNTSYTSLSDGQRVKVQVVDSDVIITSGLLTESHVTTPVRSPIICPLIKNDSHFIVFLRRRTKRF